ncbi:hypothetical protein [Deinococcus multiflagellatus]|uniref:Uncharacterized protein n=1 Tax=Deinococcus multiflagellatus TaxID=1656887 RepID=A0ABW1ZF56_9DEIO
MLWRLLRRGRATAAKAGPEPETAFDPYLAQVQRDTRAQERP